MANEWIATSGAACYNSSTAGYSLSQSNVFELGKLYIITVTVTVNAGKLTIDSLGEEITESGTYTYYKMPVLTSLTFTGRSYAGAVFVGCIDDVFVRNVPFIRIKNCHGSTVYEQTDESIVSADADTLQYEINWNLLPDGIYYIEFDDTVVTYRSDPFSLKTFHDCTILLSWNNDENAFSFEYEDLTFLPKLRVKAKKFQPNYKKDRKEVFIYSNGDRKILYSRTSKEELLSILDIPEYLHDCISIAIEHDTFLIDGVEYVCEDDEYTPKWRKSSISAPVEIRVFRKSQNLVNSNCF